MTPVSYFHRISITEAAGLSDIRTLLRTIQLGGKGGKLKHDVEEIRRYPNDKDMRKKLKRRNLPVITWQGAFSQRSNANLLMLSGIMCIDIDHRTHENICQLKASLARESWCLAAFLSPSGDGLKVLVLTDNNDIGSYHSCYCQLEDYFLRNYGAEPDNTCEPLSQGCFASYDPELYVNLNATPFHLEYDPKFDKQQKSSATAISGNGVYQPTGLSVGESLLNSLNVATNNLSDEQIIQILDKKFARYPQNYTDGHRTRSVFAQAVILCKAGIRIDTATDYLMSRFLPTGFLREKVEREARNAYYKNKVLFGSERGKYLNYSSYLKSKSRG